MALYILTKSSNLNKCKSNQMNRAFDDVDLIGIHKLSLYLITFEQGMILMVQKLCKTHLHQQSILDKEI